MPPRPQSPTDRAASPRHFTTAIQFELPTVAWGPKVSMVGDRPALKRYMDALAKTFPESGVQGAAPNDNA